MGFLMQKQSHHWGSRRRFIFRNFWNRKIVWNPVREVNLDVSKKQYCIKNRHGYARKTCRGFHASPCRFSTCWRLFSLEKCSVRILTGKLPSLSAEVWRSRVSVPTRATCCRADVPSKTRLTSRLKITSSREHQTRRRISTANIPRRQVAHMFSDHRNNAAIIFECHLKGGWLGSAEFSRSVLGFFQCTSP